MSACSFDPGDPTPDATCDGLFGSPSDNSGLPDDACTPAINGWTPTAFDDEAIQALRDAELIAPPGVPTADPYDEPVPVAAPDAVCTLRWRSGNRYELETTTLDDARGPVTHAGACGLCSSLQDLAVYASVPDLAGPVRQCGIEGFDGGLDAVDACLQDIGFSAPCARIWAYNVEYTRSVCLDSCIGNLDAPYHNADGSLNACVQCDEDESGPVFKAIAGRTRRNSGLATALCRPCDTVWRVDHAR